MNRLSNTKRLSARQTPPWILYNIMGTKGSRILGREEAEKAAQYSIA